MRNLKIILTTPLVILWYFWLASLAPMSFFVPEMMGGGLAGWIALSAMALTLVGMVARYRIKQAGKEA